MPKKSFKRRAKQSYDRSPVNNREVYKRFLIVCEGECTEPNYFRRYRELLRRQSSVIVVGAGFNTVSLIDEAARLAREHGFDPLNHDGDEVWCVFDRDSFSSEDFNGAIAKASSLSFHVAYSNEAFELWYLLHFNYYDTAFSRDTYQRRLSRLLGHEYAKNSAGMFDELRDRQQTAIRHARKLLATHLNHLPPAEKNPSTTVYLLVEALNENLRYPPQS